MGWLWQFAGLLVVLNSVGCNFRSATVYPVVGKLTYRGRPVADALIVLHPLSKSNPLRPVARTGPDGTFRVMTHKTGDGAPAGDYVVTIVWPDVAHAIDDCENEHCADLFAGRFADPATSEWRLTVFRRVNEFALKVPPETRRESKMTIGGQ